MFETKDLQTISYRLQLRYSFARHLIHSRWKRPSAQGLFYFYFFFFGSDKIPRRTAKERIPSFTICISSLVNSKPIIFCAKRIQSAMIGTRIILFINPHRLTKFFCHAVNFVLLLLCDGICPCTF